MAKHQPWREVVERPLRKVHSDHPRFKQIEALGGVGHKITDVLSCGHVRPGFFGIDHSPSKSPYRTGEEGRMFRKCDQCPREEI